MNLFERILDRMTGRRRALLGAVGQADNPMALLYAVRASAFLKITGKPLTIVDGLPTKSEKTASDLSRNLSPSRRLLRKGLE
ncbi:MAG: hypothetical protein P1Q69_08090 [Candidatus Thorarchaeota archaeon]|nr:hypothetical protein [Candidatus Thorarchaeota archaeon]